MRGDPGVPGPRSPAARPDILRGNGLLDGKVSGVAIGAVYEATP